MTWNEYKNQIKQMDPIGKTILEEAEADASVLSEMIRHCSAPDLSRRDPALHCNIPQSFLD